jgi:uncharacterized membrane protein YfcA
MTFIKTTLGYFLAALITATIWPFLVNTFGLIGGFLAAPLLITPLWYLNHRKGLIYQPKEAVFIDMSLAIAVSAWLRDMLRNDINGFTLSLPTLITVSIAGIFAGLFVVFVNRYWEKQK